MYVSIRAAHTERRPYRSLPLNRNHTFQSTPPARTRSDMITRSRSGLAAVFQSTAARAGNDAPARPTNQPSRSFKSTPPARAATLRDDRWRVHQRFNPRRPRGQLTRTHPHNPTLGVSIHAAPRAGVATHQLTVFLEKAFQSHAARAIFIYPRQSGSPPVCSSFNPRRPRARRNAIAVACATGWRRSFNPRRPRRRQPV